MRYSLVIDTEFPRNFKIGPGISKSVLRFRIRVATHATFTSPLCLWRRRWAKLPWSNARIFGEFFTWHGMTFHFVYSEWSHVFPFPCLLSFHNRRFHLLSLLSDNGSSLVVWFTWKHHLETSSIDVFERFTSGLLSMIAFQAQLGQDHTLSQRKEFERVKARKLLWTSLLQSRFQHPQYSLQS